MQVHGFQRSGNHYLAWLLKENFFQDMELSGICRSHGHHKNRSKIPVRLSYLKLLQHGHTAPGPSIEESIYIYRDGRAVAASIWSSEYFRPDDNVEFSEFLKLPLDWRFTTARATVSELTLPEHWMEMLDIWRGTDPYLIRYEDLVLNPEKELLAIGERFGLKSPDSIILPDHDVGFSPSSNKIDGWKKLFTDQDLDFFFSKVPNDYWGLFDAR